MLSLTPYPDLLFVYAPDLPLKTPVDYRQLTESLAIKLNLKKEKKQFLQTSSCMPHSRSIVTQASIGKAISRPLTVRCSSKGFPKEGFSIQASVEDSSKKKKIQSKQNRFTTLELLRVTLPSTVPPNNCIQKDEKIS